MSEVMSVQNGTSSGCAAVGEHRTDRLSIPHVLPMVHGQGLAAQTVNKQPGNSPASQSARSLFGEARGISCESGL